MDRTAEFSADRRHRLSLHRIWDPDLPILPVVMLNPSVADEERNDQTVTELTRRARALGYGGLSIRNLFTLIATDPADLVKRAKAGEIVRCFRAEAVMMATLHSARQRRQPVLVAWGNHGSLYDASAEFAKLAAELEVELICLGTTQSGQPKHPLARGRNRIRPDFQPVRWRG